MRLGGGLHNPPRAFTVAQHEHGQAVTALGSVMEQDLRRRMRVDVQLTAVGQADDVVIELQLTVVELCAQLRVRGQGIGETSVMIGVAANDDQPVGVAGMCARMHADTRLQHDAALSVQPGVRRDIGQILRVRAGFAVELLIVVDRVDEFAEPVDAVAQFHAQIAEGVPNLVRGEAVERFTDQLRPIRAFIADLIAHEGVFEELTLAAGGELVIRIVEVLDPFAAIVDR